MTSAPVEKKIKGVPRWFDQPNTKAVAAVRKAFRCPGCGGELFRASTYWVCPAHLDAKAVPDIRLWGDIHEHLLWLWKRAGRDGKKFAALEHPAPRGRLRAIQKWLRLLPALTAPAKPARKRKEKANA